MPGERAVARLLREAVDLDSERGVAILGADRRSLYSNAAARTLLRDGTERGLDALLPQSVDQAVEALLVSVRMQRAPLSVEVFYPSEVERRVRVGIEAVWHDLGLYVIVRALPVTPWTEPTVRRLQTRFGLTLREAQVAVGVARGQSNSEVAGSLGIVEKTVKNVLMSVYQKCEVRNRVELALRAYDAPLASAEARP
jgi:DNA-binding NarL/FixJ family response regulator